MKKRENGAWAIVPYSEYKQNEVETTSFPLNFYAKGDNIPDWTLSGNCYQASTPTPSNPVDVEECGDLVTSGEHAGQYVISIINAGQTLTIYLSEPLRKIGDYADTVDESGVVIRKIKRTVFDGSENWQFNNDTAYLYTADALISTNALCTHFSNVSVDGNSNISIPASTFSSLSDFTTFLAQQYANGTPVTVWYVLATPTTESITPVSIPTAAGTNTLDIGTSLAPSKFEADLGKMFVPALEKVRVNGVWT